MSAIPQATISIVLLLMAAAAFFVCARKTAHQLSDGRAVVAVWAICALLILLLAAIALWGNSILHDFPAGRG